MDMTMQEKIGWLWLSYGKGNEEETFNKYLDIRCEDRSRKAYTFREIEGRFTILKGMKVIKQFKPTK